MHVPCLVRVYKFTQVFGKPDMSSREMAHGACESLYQNLDKLIKDTLMMSGDPSSSFRAD